MPHCTFRAGRTHVDVHARDADWMALGDGIAAQNYLSAGSRAAARCKALAPVQSGCRPGGSGLRRIPAHA